MTIVAFWQVSVDQIARHVEFEPIGPVPKFRTWSRAVKRCNFVAGNDYLASLNIWHFVPPIVGNGLC